MARRIYKSLRKRKSSRGTSECSVFEHTHCEGTGLEKYPFELNPIQQIARRYTVSDENVLVVAPTSSGKTIAGEILVSDVLKAGKRVVYLSPLKALVEEKIFDWQEDSHPWSKISKFLMTGDYAITNKREKELLKAQIIISTYEMMAVRARRQNVETSKWLDEVGAVVVDEAHFIGSEGRGDHLENALLAFTRRNSQAKVVFLSATIKNVEEISTWLMSLNGKATVRIESEHRPCELTVHYRMLQNKNPYSKNAFLDATILTVEEFEEDQWLLFVHTKADGRLLEKTLKNTFPSKVVAFHCADLDRDRRAAIEKGFKERHIDYLVATSTLAYGVNLPARRVLIFSCTRAGKYVDVADIIQECGRAGRPKYDSSGDAYVLLSQKDGGYFNRLKKGVVVHSKLMGRLPFHLLGEVAERRVKCQDDVGKWLERSLAYKQGLCEEDDSSLCLDELEEWGVIQEKDSGYGITKLGKIASYFYFNPQDVVSWRNNLRIMRDRGLWRDSAAIAWMVSSVMGREGYLPADSKNAASEVLSFLRPLNLKVYNNSSLARAAAIFAILRRDLDKGNYSVKAQVQGDIDRTLACIEAINSRCFPAYRLDPFFWDRLRYRIKYELEFREADLCLLPGIGQVYSRQLVGRGIDTLETFAKNKEGALQIVPAPVYEKALAAIPHIMSKRKKVYKWMQT